MAKIYRENTAVHQPKMLCIALLKWYKKNKRDMPWRKSKEPYKIWLSEIILQQTQVVQGTPYFEKFIEKFPTLSSLAIATENEVLRLWQGLGYYSRARNLLATAQFIHNQLAGIFPNTYHELLKLRGVGEYTAAAIASIVYGEPIAVVDGNVKRVISRLFMIALPPAKSHKKIGELAQSILVTNKAAEHNQAIMELGSLICKPKNPHCNLCPISDHCSAYQNQVVSQYPIKAKNKKKSKIRYFNFIVCVNSNGEVYLEQRQQDDIWKNMYTFPLIETEVKREEQGFLQNSIPSEFEVLRVNKSKHLLSHQIIYASFFVIKLKHESLLHGVEEPSAFVPLSLLNQWAFDKFGATFEKNNIFEVEIKHLMERYSFPRIITKYMENKEVSTLLNSLCR